MDAQTNLGMMYYRGEGVAADLTEASRWLQRAAEQGDVEAANLLAQLASHRDSDRQSSPA